MSIASLQYMKLTNSPSTNRPVFTLRCSQADGGQLRRPSVATPIPVVSPLPEKMAVAAVVGEKSGVTVTMEYQRQRAKEMQQYFKKKKSEESSQGPFFGFLPKNEISNGRPSVATPIQVVSPLPETMAAAAVIGEKSEVTMEYQRQRAKEMQQYFKKKKSEESSQGPFFGFNFFLRMKSLTEELDGAHYKGISCFAEQWISDF